MLKELSREQRLMLLGLILAVVVGSSVMVFRRFFNSSDTSIIIESPLGSFASQESTNAIFVHVTGAVNDPGVYKLPYGKRVMDVIELAGGSANNADLDPINLAQVLKDEQKVAIPTKKESTKRAAGQGGPGKSGTSSGPVNLNTADEQTLDSLPGIGKATAGQIIEYREKKGGFSRIEEIMEIPRFGKAKFEKIKDKIVI